MKHALVAIVGRPNVGKSTFFNFLAGRRISIIDDTPGVTRDRLYTDIDWLNHRMTMIDTGGIEPESNDDLLQHMRMQAEVAIDTCDAILFVVDMKTGLHASDLDIATMLRKSGKPVLLVVNKVDNPGQPPADIYEFYRLGFSELHSVSAVHGLGIGDLLDRLVEVLPDTAEDVEEEESISVAIVGKPNAGKSSLLNLLAGEERAIVSDVAGTTRDPINTTIRTDKQKYVFVDTAGMRRKSRIDDAIERYSIIRAIAAIERSDVCLLMIDAVDGVTEQDTKIAGLANRNGKAVIIIINKWDLIQDKDTNTMADYTRVVREKLIFMSYAPIVFISALNGQRTERILPMIDSVYEQSTRRIKTGVFNDLIGEVTAMHPAPQYKGRRLKISYATQVAVQPPEFVLFVNSTDLIHFSYDRYLENEIRRAFGFEGTPIRLTFRNKDKNDKQ